LVLIGMVGFRETRSLQRYRIPNPAWWVNCPATRVDGFKPPKQREQPLTNPGQQGETAADDVRLRGMILDGRGAYQDAERKRIRLMET